MIVHYMVTHLFEMAPCNNTFLLQWPLKKKLKGCPEGLSIHDIMFVIGVELREPFIHFTDKWASPLN